MSEQAAGSAASYVRGDTSAALLTDTIGTAFDRTVTRWGCLELH